MLQRIQSIFMLIAVVAMLSILFFPIWKKVSISPENDVIETIHLNAFYCIYYKQNEEEVHQESKIEKSTLLISIGSILSACVMLYSIFQYTTRTRQIKLNTLFSLLAGLTLAGMGYYISKANQLVITEIPGSYLFGFYLPLVALFCNLIANRLIRKDEKLVREAYRLR